MPLPITAPIPSEVRLHGPNVRLSLFSGSSEDAISASILIFRKRLTWEIPPGPPAGARPGRSRFNLRLALALALLLVTDLFLLGPARHAGRPLGFRSRLFAGRALQLFAFFFI